MHCCGQREDEGMEGMGRTNSLGLQFGLGGVVVSFLAAGDTGGNRCGDQGGRGAEEDEERAGEHFAFWSEYRTKVYN